MKRHRISLLLGGGLLLACFVYSFLFYYSKSYEKNKLSLFKAKSTLLQKTFRSYTESGLNLLREVLLAEQAVAALQSKSNNQLIQLGFLLRAIQQKSSIPGMQLCVLDEKGNFLGGSTRLKAVDPAVVMLGLYGEERLFARAGGSFFEPLYVEGIAPLLRAGKVSGLVHLEMPLGEELLRRARAATGDEVFLFTRSELEHSSLFSNPAASERKPYLELLHQELVQSQLQAAYLDLAGDRTKQSQVAINPLASSAIVPLRGMGGEVVAMLVALVPESGFPAYRAPLLQGAFWGICFFAAMLLLRALVFAALRLSRLSQRTVVVVFAATCALFAVAWMGMKGAEAYLWRSLQQENAAVVGNLSTVYRDYQNYLFESVGQEREEMKRDFLGYLRGEPVRKPARYEFAEIPLGVRGKPPMPQATASHVPLLWNGVGVFSDKADGPFSREKGVYKVPVARFAQKIWLAYSSAWGYLNKFGSPYGTKIGSVKVFFENGNSLEIELQNGVNVHDRFSPPQGSAAEEPKSAKAFEFISEEDPLHRMQYVEELEFTVPLLYAESKIDYLVFEDAATPDVPIFYGVTLGMKKVPAVPAPLATLREAEMQIQLKEEFVKQFAGASFVYYIGDRAVETSFASSEKGAVEGTRAPEAAVQETLIAGKTFREKGTTYWPIADKEGEKPSGMIAVITPAAYVGPLQHAAGFVDAGFIVFLLILGVVWLGNVIVSWKKLRFKLISFSFLVSCVPLFLVVALVGFLMRQREDGMARQQAAKSLDLAEIFISDVKTRVEDVALRLCGSEQLVAAVQKKEGAEIERLLSDVKIASLADFPGSFMVVRKGEEAQTKEEWGTANYNSLPHSTKKLLEESRSGLFVNNVTSAILGVNQVYLPAPSAGKEGERLSVTAGIPMDAYFLSEMKRRAGADISLFIEENLRLSTLSLADKKGGKNLNALAHRQFAALLREGKSQFAAADLDKKKAVFGFLPIKDEAGRVVGMLSATLWREKTLLPGFSAKKVFVFVALFILALAGLMSYMISRSITNPIASLARGAERIAGGELGSRIGVEAQDEIGDLAQSFNHMSESLKENRDHLEQKIADLLTLQKLSTKVSSVLEKEELMHLVVKLFVELAGFEKGMLLLRDAETHRFVVQSGIGIRRSDFGKVSYLAEETLAGTAVKERGMIFVENHLTDERVPHHSIHRKGGDKPLLILALPLLAKGNEVGAVILEHPAEKRPSVRVEEVLLMTLANHAAIALENARLYEMAVEDGLTKVFVNRYFQFRLAEEVEHVKRYHSHLSLVLVDLDYFKTANDTYGHQVGDKILIATAQTMKKTFRASDVVCRYGGDEFAIILPKTGGDEALHIAERLRHEVEKLDFRVDEKIFLRVTLSIGVAAWAAPMDREALIKAADHALYAAKTGGRNRVARFSQTA